MKKTLKNGLQVRLVPMKTKSVVVFLTFDVGSFDDSVPGISHLLEHMIFEGSKNYSTPLILAKTIDDVGGEMNAGTSKNRIEIYVRVPQKHLARAINVISDMVIHPLFLPKQFEEEKQVVRREVAMILDNPKAKSYQTFEQMLFGKHAFSQPIAGTDQSVISITREQVIEHHKQFFCAKNAILVIGGDLKKIPKEVKIFEQMHTGKRNIRKMKKPQPMKVSLKLSATEAYFYTGFIVPKIIDPTYGVFEVIEAILSKGQSGLLFDAFRHKHGVSYDVNAEYQSTDITGTFSIAATTSHKKIPFFKKTVQEVFAQLKHVTQEDLNRAKDYIFGKYALEMESPLIQAEQVAMEYLDNVKPYEKIIKEVTLQQVKDALAYFATAKVLVSEKKNEKNS